MENLKNTQIEMAFTTSTLHTPSPEDKKAGGKFTIYADGACNPNPHGIGCWAYVVYDAEGNQIAQDYGDIGRGEGVTNNVAEYHAVIEGLKKALEFPCESEVLVHTDSQLVVNQLNGKFACNPPHLKMLLDELRELVCLTNAVLEWVPREKNQVADYHTRLAYIQAKRRYEGGGND